MVQHEREHKWFSNMWIRNQHKPRLEASVVQKCSNTCVCGLFRFVWRTARTTVRLRARTGVFQHAGLCCTYNSRQTTRTTQRGCTLTTEASRGSLAQSARALCHQRTQMVRVGAQLCGRHARLAHMHTVQCNAAGFALLRD